MPIRKCLILIVLLLLFNFSETYTQEHLFDVQHLTTEDGLSNLLTSTIFKDQEGLIWASTEYGLNRYDGYAFQLFTKEKNNLQRNNQIHRIEEDKAGNLWYLDRVLSLHYETLQYRTKLFQFSTRMKRLIVSSVAV